MGLRWMSLAVALAGFGTVMPAAKAASNAEYLATRAKTTLTTLASTKQLASQLPALTGQVIELQGTVNGVINSDDGVGYLLNVGSETHFVHAKTNDPAYRVGNPVRVMLRVHPGGTMETVSVTESGPDLVRADFATLRLQNPSGTTDDPFAGTPNPGVPKQVVEAKPQGRTAPALMEANEAKAAEAQLPYIYYDGSGNKKASSDVLYDGRTSEEVRRLASAIRQYNSDLNDDMVEKIAFHINEKSERYGMDPWLIFAMVAQESRFNPRAVSHAGAQGLGQLMPGTAAHLGVNDPFDIEQNLDGAVKYLSQQMRAFGNHTLALAAYNAGPGNVKKYGGVPPFRETQKYVKVIWSNYCRLSGETDSGSRYD